MVVIGVRLAWVVVVTVLLMVAIRDASVVLALQVGALKTALVICGMFLIVALQLYQSHAASHDHRPRAWRITLAFQAVLVYSFLFPFVWTYNGELAPFLAGSMLLLLPNPWRWVGYGTVVVSYAVLVVVLPLQANNIVNGIGPQLPVVLNYAVEIAGIGLLVYGLTRLAALVRQMAALQDRIAEMAALQERLRVARDVHDLLGLGLSAIALKADLVGALIERDDARATAEIQEISRICAAATADIRLVMEGHAQLALRDELDAAKHILASAGIRVHAVTSKQPLPEVADEVLAPVLREAVTNILRHSAATRCEIEVQADVSVVQLRVSNDGISRRPDSGRPSDQGAGRGLANLDARIASAGGHLASHQADGWFVLVAKVPLRTRDDPAGGSMTELTVRT